MSGLIAYLDHGLGESRAVVVRDRRPHRLLIEREGVEPAQALGARSVGRVRRIDRGLGLAFIELAGGPDGATPAGRLAEGQFVELRITAEARVDKGAVLQVLGPAQGPPRVLEPSRPLEARLAELAPGANIETGPVARAAADEAEDEALQTVHALPGGGRLIIEPTSALVSVDVDIADRRGGDARRLARQANLVAIGETARLLRLKGLGGLVVIDLVGKGHDGTAISAAVRSAFAEEGPQVSIGPISRFGLFELSLPQAQRSVSELLLGPGREPSNLTLALRLLRTIEGAATADPGGRVQARCALAVAEAAAPYVAQLHARWGARIEIRPAPELARMEVQVSSE